MTSRRPRRRVGRRRFPLRVSGPLARTSDRLQAVSRLVFVLLLVSTVPLAVVAGGLVHGRAQGAAAAERTDRFRVAATLLADSTAVADPYTAAGSATATAPAAWDGPQGYRQERVQVAAGSRAGTVVHIWVNRAGTPSSSPLGDGDVAAYTISAVVLTVSGVAGVALLAHLSVVGLLHRSRMRRWSREWATVEPLWASGFR